MFRRALASLGLGAFLVSSPLLAAVPPASTRAPTGKWVVDFDDSQCVASRNYGTKAQPLLFGLKAPIISDVMQLIFVRPGSGGGGEFAEQLGGTITLDGGMAKSISAIGLSVPKAKQRVVRVNLPTSEFAAIAGAKVMDIRVRGEMKESIALSNMPALLNVLNKCVADLRTHWNVEPREAERPVSSVPDESDGANAFLRHGPRGDLTGVFKADDFPSAAIAKDMQGTVRLAMLIDENGKVADCTVVGTSGSAALDGQSCYIVSSRARFKPAIGLDGKPARSTYSQRVTWRIGN